MIVAGRDLAKASRLARQIRGIPLQLDVTDTPSIELALKPFRRIDLFVNCAGVSREESLDDVSEAAWDEVLGTNLKAAMFLAQAVARRQKRGGRQVHLLSVRAQLGLRGRGYSVDLLDEFEFGVSCIVHAAFPHTHTSYGTGFQA